MKVRQLVDGIEYEVIKGSLELEIKDISYDSRTVNEQTAFLALKGIDTDGHKYINQALIKGCKCIIICEDIKIPEEDITIIKVDDTRKKLAYISENLFKHPADNLIKIGITGTKGKTTTSYMIKSILEASGHKVGVIGTVGTTINGVLYEHKNTTPESYLIQKYFRKMVEEKVEYVIMEVSSQALKVGRVSNIFFDYAIFTNLSIDHIGSREHPTFEDYVESKSLLFKQSAIGILNKEDAYYDSMIKDSTCKVYTFGEHNCDLELDKVQYYSDATFMGIQMQTKNMVKDSFLVKAPGLFSAYNAMCAIELGDLLEIDIQDIKKGLETFYVPGRCEIYNLDNHVKAIIDYAHNKISMESIIKTMKEYKTGRVIAIFGCGGGRSDERRFELGEMAGTYADFSIVTMDNPRNDSIEEINKVIKEGIESVNGKYIVITDREKAIRYAIENAKENDIILLLGKGHEKFQQIGTEIYSFDEEAIIKEYI